MEVGEYLLENWGFFPVVLNSCGLNFLLIWALKISVHLQDITSVAVQQCFPVTCFLSFPIAISFLFPLWIYTFLFSFTPLTHFDSGTCQSYGIFIFLFIVFCKLDMNDNVFIFSLCYCIFVFNFGISYV